MQIVFTLDDDPDKGIQDVGAFPEHLLTFLQKSHPSYLQALKRSPRRAVEYASTCLKARWFEVESVIAASPYYAYLYAHTVVGERWTQGELAISRNPQSAYLYARYVIEGRWIPGEVAILRSPYYACWYSITVLKTRWPEAEHLFCTPRRAPAYGDAFGEQLDETAAAMHPYWAYRYACDVVGGKLPPKLHNKMQLWAIAGRYKNYSYVRRYLTGRKFQ